MIFIIANSYLTIIPTLESSQKTLFKIILQTQVETYNKNYTAFVIALSLGAGLNFICLDLLAYFLHANITSFYPAYLLMKHHEIDIHCDHYSNKLKSFEENALDEAPMLGEYIQMNWTLVGRRAVNSAEVQRQAQLAASAKGGGQVYITPRQKKLKRDRVQVSSLYLQGVNLFYGAFILLLILLSLTFNRMSSQIISFQQFFITTNDYVADVNKYLHTYILLTNFGNYMKIDGQFVSSGSKKYSIENMINYFSQNKLMHTQLLQDKYHVIFRLFR